MPAIMIALFSLFSLMFRSDDPAPDQDRPVTRADLKREIKNLMAGDPDEAANRLADILADNQKYRKSQHRLTDEQWADYQAMQALGKKPSEIRAELDRVAKLESDLATYTKKEQLAAVAEKGKIANAAALAGLLGDREFEVIDIPGGDPQVLIVEGGNKTPIREYVKNRMAWAESVLFTENQQAPQGGADDHTLAGAAQGAAQSTNGAAQGAARPIPFAQGSGGTPAQGAGAFSAADKAKELNEARNAGVKNPLATA
jgi:hypothetical protein